MADKMASDVLEPWGTESSAESLNMFRLGIWELFWKTSGTEKDRGKILDGTSQGNSKGTFRVVVEVTWRKVRGSICE